VEVMTTFEKKGTNYKAGNSYKQHKKWYRTTPTCKDINNIPNRKCTYKRVHWGPLAK